jgi:hypothetical protein
MISVLREWYLKHFEDHGPLLPSNPIHRVVAVIPGRHRLWRGSKELMRETYSGPLAVGADLTRFVIGGVFGPDLLGAVCGVESHG